jgi:group II intron reverse transcriptase/maturase
LKKADAEQPVTSKSSEQHSAGSGSHAETPTELQSRTNAEPALMEAALERGNLKRAYDRVLRNKGAAGVDDLEVSELGDYLRKHWPTIRARLLEGTYHPQAVRRVSIPKPNGGERHLGIPTVLDRFIQQALHQVLSPLFEPTFSDNSYGFRPGRSAQQAVQAAQTHVLSGHGWVVDVDLEQFFDRVNHDVLMGRVERQVTDRRILKLIRRYLKAGLLVDGLESPRREGTPQGGPLSPLLSNILLTDLDRELETRGHKFVRYADDIVVYVRSERSGLRVLDSVRRFAEKRLKLKVSEKKSAVAKVSKRTFLGYSISASGQLLIAMESRRRLFQRLRQLLRRARGRTLRHTIEQLNPVLRGWSAYFKLARATRPLEVIDGWVRRKLRCILWRQWKRNYTRARYLMRLGLSEERAWRSAVNGRGPWWNAGASHMNQALPKRRFDRMGLVSVLDTVRRLQRLS